jgi:cell division protein FtsB
MPVQGLGALFARAALPAACLLVVAYFGTHAVMGEAGILALDGIRAERERLLADQQVLEARRADLETRISLLDPRGADPDYADELVRRHLGVMRPDEIVIPLPPED